MEFYKSLSAQSAFYLKYSLSVYKAAAKIFFSSFYYLMVFQVIFLMFVGIFSSAIFGFLYNYFGLNVPSDVSLNAQIITFLRSIKGAITLGIAALITFFIYSIEKAMMMFIAIEKDHEPGLPMMTIFLNFLKKLPQEIKVIFIKSSVYGSIAVPFLFLSLLVLLYYGGRVFSITILLSIFAISFIISAFATSWIFVDLRVSFEDKGVREAFKIKLDKRMRRVISFVRISWYILIVVIGIVISFLIGLLLKLDIVVPGSQLRAFAIAFSSISGTLAVLVINACDSCITAALYFNRMKP